MVIYVQRNEILPPDRIVVPPGHVWLSGDNPYNSTDSRDYGVVPAALIQGRVILRFWPSSFWWAEKIQSQMSPTESAYFIDEVDTETTPEEIRSVFRRFFRRKEESAQLPPAKKEDTEKLPPIN